MLGFPLIKKKIREHCLLTSWSFSSFFYNHKLSGVSEVTCSTIYQKSFEYIEVEDGVNELFE